MATQILIIDGEKLKKARGIRSRGAVARAANKAFSPQQLLAWENNKYRPRPEIIPVLLEALGVDYKTVTSPLERKTPRRATRE